MYISKEKIGNDNTIYKLIIALLLISQFFTTNKATAQETTLIEITGQVINEETNTPLSGISVQVKGTPIGTVSNNAGEFAIRTKTKIPFVIVFSSVGYQAREYEVKSVNASLHIALATQMVLSNEVVVKATKYAESNFRSPVAVEQLNIRSIKESPAPSFYDALENIKGVQMTTSSLTFKIPNTRGFNIPNNFRFMQLVDGVDMQAATLGVPLGNAIGPTELDIQSIEITPGAASALYGMNAINGMANLITKSPFTTQGFSIYQKTALNHIDGIDSKPSMLTETAIRYAKAFKKHFAFKINASYMRGTDWSSNNGTDQNPNTLNTANTNLKSLTGASNPAYDAWNKYGDESNNAITLNGINNAGNYQTLIVRRTGYWEKDLVKPKVDNLKLDAALFYKIGNYTTLSYGYRVGKMDGVFQRGNKIQLDNVVVQNHRMELKGKNYFVRSYMSIENTGNSFNLKPLADNLQLTHLSNKEWGSVFKNELQKNLDSGIDMELALQLARKMADAGRAEPGTEAFKNLKHKIIQINNWDHANAGIAGAPATGGAWLSQKSRTYHTDAQWNLSDKIKFVDLLVGADVRIYEIIPDGNNFVDFSRPIAERNNPKSNGSFGNNIYYKKYGGFAQITKALMDDRLRIYASIRYDHNLEFAPKVNPRIAATYTVAHIHNFRASLQNGYRYPALFEALSFVNNGNVRRVGGLPYINKGLGYLENSFTMLSVNAFNAAVNKDVANGLNANDAALKNKAILQIANLPNTRPERIRSFEVGYKTILLNKKMVVDVDAYSNTYDSFLGQAEVSVPINGNVGTDKAAIDMLAENKKSQNRYRVFTNARNSYRNYGWSAGVTYNFYKTYTFSGNINYNNIVSNKTSDIFITAFNTPKWISNLSFGNRAITKNIGFNVVWKWQDAFTWESPLANGNIAAYSTVDAQVTYKIPQKNASIKFGGANVFNNRYIQYAAGPTIGGLYYVAITLDGLIK